MILFTFLVTISLAQTVSAQIPQAETDAFIRKRVGDDYFLTHYSHSRSAQNNGLIKALYNFSYPPFVTNFPMTIFYDTETKNLSAKEVSRILLFPQNFSVDKNGAITIALQEGLVSSNNYQTELLLDLTTDNRFAWDITSLEALSNQGKYVNKVYRIILDVDTGKILFKTTIHPADILEKISEPPIERGLRLNTQFLAILTASLISAALIAFFIWQRQRKA